MELVTKTAAAFGKRIKRESKRTQLYIYNIIHVHCLPALPSVQRFGRFLSSALPLGMTVNAISIRKLSRYNRVSTARKTNQNVLKINKNYYRRRTLNPKSRRFIFFLTWDTGPWPRGEKRPT